MEPSRSPDVNVTDVFKEISHNILRYNYRPQPEDVIAIRGCCKELSKLPAIELTNVLEPRVVPCLSCAGCMQRPRSFHRQVNELSVKPPRIATGAASTSLPSTIGRKLPSQKQSEGTGAATQQDPFDICSDATESVQAVQPQMDAKSQMEERRRKRQEAYRQRRELRKQQRQGVLLGDIGHQDVFGHQSK